MSGFAASILLVLFLLGWAGLKVCLRLAGRGSSGTAEALPEGSPGKVLIFTAAVGGGHEAAGRAARAELERAGYTVAMTDGLREMSRVLDWLLVRGYRRQVRGAPRTLGAVFAVTSRRMGAATIRGLTGLLFANRLLGILERERPDLVLSTYPLATSVLGALRKDGRLRVPAVAVVPDYGVHPLWVDPNMDLHLVVSRPSAVLAEQAGGKASVVRMPVEPALMEAPAREEARAALGLPRERFVVLVVGGAWGIGDLGEASRCAARSDACTIVVTGNNAALEERLAAEFSCEEDVRILGWRDDLPVLMAAADCLIQNAGGMTCIEAIEKGLPILMFDPILGHGEFNARVMERAGVARWARSAEDLRALLRAASRREASPGASGAGSFAPTISETITPLIGATPRPAVARRSLSPRPAFLTGAAVLASFLWLIFASPGVALAARGLHLRIPGYAPSPGEVSLAVRVDDPATAAALESSALRERVPVTIFATPEAGEELHPAPGVAFGVAEEPAVAELPSWGERQEDRRTASEIQRATGTYPGYFLATPKPDLAALAEAPSGTRMVMPERDAAGGARPGLLVVDSSGLGPDAARQRFLRTLQKIRGGGLECVPLYRL